MTIFPRSVRILNGLMIDPEMAALEIIIYSASDLDQCQALRETYLGDLAKRYRVEERIP